MTETLNKQKIGERPENAHERETFLQWVGDSEIDVARVANFYAPRGDEAKQRVQARLLKPLTDLEIVPTADRLARQYKARNWFQKFCGL